MSAESTAGGRKADADWTPAPPEGQGPVLAWYRPSQWNAAKGAVGVMVTTVLGVILLQGFSIAWMGYWQLWLGIFVIAVVFYGSQRHTAVSAGSEWLQHGGKWVRTYELTRVTAHPRIASIRLHLVDQDGRRVRVSNHDLHQDSGVWDLVHKGIVHSVIKEGAETNGLLHQAFNIPRPRPGPDAEPAG